MLLGLESRNKFALRAVTAALLGCTLVVAGCKRDAVEAIPRAALFPNKPAAGDPVRHNPFGALARAKAILEIEPNDGPETAQLLAVQTVISAAVGPPGDVPGASDWYALDTTVGAGQVLRLSLLQAPKCAVLTITDGDGKTLQRAITRGGRVVLDHLQPSATMQFATVLCRANSAAKPQPAGGNYRLQLSSRPSVPGEELEPNDSLGTASPGLAIGASVQGTLAHRRDTDRWRLPTAAEPDGQPLTLSVTGLPGVGLQLKGFGADGVQLFKRRGGRGEPLLIPNFNRAMRGATSLGLNAVGGRTSDHVYVLALREQLPTAAAAVTGSEPSDRRSEANVIALDHTERGIIDGAGDVDWFALDVAIGTALEVTLRCPRTVKARLVAHVGDGAPAWATAGSEGATLKLPRLVAAAERVWIRIHGVGKSHDPGEAYQLEVANMSALDDALDLSGLATPDLATVATPSAHAD
jgi:hypothetical protein